MGSGSGLWLGLGLGCVSLSLSVPGVSTARPAACADQPSRRSTACRGTRRGRPRRGWRARRPSRAAHRCPAYGDGSGPPGSYHPAAAVRSRRLGTRSPCDAEPTSRRHTWTRRPWPAWPRKRCAGLRGIRCAASARRASDAAPARLQAFVASDGGGEGAGRGSAGRAGRHGLRRRPPGPASALGSRHQVSCSRGGSAD